MRRPATRVASRPSVSPSAFTTCQRLSISPAFMLYVFIRFIVKQTVLIANLHQAEPTARGRATGRPRPRLPQHRLELLRGELPPPYFHQGRDDAAHLAAQEGVGLHVQRQAGAPPAPLTPHRPPHPTPPRGPGAPPPPRWRRCSGTSGRSPFAGGRSPAVPLSPPAPLSGPAGGGWGAAGTRPAGGGWG